VPVLRTTLLLALAQVVVPPSIAVQMLPSAVRWTVLISASPVAPPLIGKDQVFVVLQSGVVEAHRVTDGTTAWKLELRSEFPVAMDDDHVYVAAGEAVHALKPADGSEQWLAPSGNVTAPLLAHGGWVIAATEKSLTAYRAADGTKVWSREVGTQRVIASLEGDNLYVPLEDGRLVALDLQTGAERWVRHVAGPLSEVLALPERVYVRSADKHLYCFRASDGERDWRFLFGAVVRGRPAADDKRIYVTSMDNTIRAYRRSNGELLWHPAVPFRPTSGPELIESAVIVSGNSPELHAFDASTGRPAGKITLDEPLAMPPAFGRSGDAVVMSVFTGNLKDQWKLVLTGPSAPAPATPRE
jgi:outer membrane protein assembly factor BamB